MVRSTPLLQKSRRFQVTLLRWARSWSTPTAITLGLFGVAGTLLGSWFAGVDPIVEGFRQIHLWQNHPHWLLQVPEVSLPHQLTPLVGIGLIAVAIIRLSPQPRLWSRVAGVGILMALMVRYLLWRSLTTLNLADPLNGVFSLGLFALELLSLVFSFSQLWLVLTLSDRRHEADQVAQAVISGNFLPSVDILIPTYNESKTILQRTIIGCQALEYPHKTIYLLDDTRRPEIQQLAAELGCEYMTRPHNDYAKAGNLNHAIARTNGELIVVFDADFIPTKNFLTRTIGFFQDPTVGIVQTPQSFYNPDPIARNLGLENILLPEEEFFYRQIQPSRDGIGTAICVGTSFVMRRKALEKNQGFVTDSLCEDYFTGITILSQGYRILYLNEKLSAGLAANSIADHLAQRIRWCQGTLQGLFIASNPLTIVGLNIRQRIANLEGMLYWFSHLTSVGFLLMPLAYTFLKLSPLQASVSETLYFFLPYYLLQLTLFSWLNFRSRSMLLSSIYIFIFCLPLSATIIKTILDPFEKAFKVTPKGMIRHRFEFNWSLAFPLLVLMSATALGLGFNLYGLITGEIKEAIGIGFGLFWSSYNLIILCVSLWILWDAPQLNHYEWYECELPVEVESNNGKIGGKSLSISEGGIEIKPDRSFSPNQIHTLEGSEVIVAIPSLSLQLKAQVAEITAKKTDWLMHLSFLPYFEFQKRQIIEALYCRPYQWKTCKIPNEWISFLWLTKVALMPHVLFANRQKQPLNLIEWR